MIDRLFVASIFVLLCLFVWSWVHYWYLLPIHDCPFPSLECH